MIQIRPHCSVWYGMSLVVKFRCVHSVHEERSRNVYYLKSPNLQNGKILHVSKPMSKYSPWYDTLQFHTCDICHVRISHYYYKNPTFPGPSWSICMWEDITGREAQYSIVQHCTVCGKTLQEGGATSHNLSMACK